MNLLSTPRGRRGKQLAALIVVAFAAVPVVDVALPVGYAAAVIYIPLIFVAALSGRVRWVAATSGVALVATVVAAVFKPRLTVPMPETAILFNRVGISIAIVVAGLVASLMVVRSERLTAVSDKLSSTSVELGEQSRLLRVASEAGRIAGWSIDRDEGSSVAWSDGVEKILGMKLGARSLPRDALAFVSSHHDRDRLVSDAFESLRNGTPFIETFRATREDGCSIWVTVMGEAVRNNLGRIVGLAGAIQEVTLQKEAEATANDQRRRFAQFANSVPSIIWTADSSGGIDYFNDALIDFTGLKEKDLLGAGWMSVVHPDDVESVSDEWQRSLATGEPYSTTFRMRRADGEYRWFRVNARPEQEDGGSVVKWWGNAADVHESRLLREEATRLARDLDALLNTGDMGVFTLDPEFRFTYLNDRAQAMLGGSADELLGVGIGTLSPRFVSTPMAEVFAAALDTGEIQRVSDYDSALGVWIDAAVTATPEGIAVYFRDDTELRGLRDQLAQAQRMESIGRLTGGVAHDFNNLLTVVVGGAEALEDDPGLTDEGHETLDLIARAAARGAELTHQLLAFSRRQQLAPQVVDVSARIREMAPILSRAIGHGIIEVAGLEEGLPPALVDPGQLENALLNLAINARDAMPDGGTLTISTELTSLDEAFSTMHSEVLPGDYILVSVGDTGTGIASEHLPHIFEPFFTTKEVGEGSGLGLAMVWGFAKQSGGHITAYSEAGLGSVFHLYLPVSTKGAAPHDAPPVHADMPSRGTGHILLAEDDPLVRGFAAERLLDHGFEVTVASTGKEALELLEGIDDLALLFTDVIMVGGVSGRELANAVTTLRPGTPVLFASGYPEDVIVQPGRLDPGVDLLAKPYTGRELIERIHAALGSNSMGVRS